MIRIDDQICDIHKQTIAHEASEVYSTTGWVNMVLVVVVQGCACLWFQYYDARPSYYPVPVCAVKMLVFKENALCRIVWAY